MPSGWRQTELGNVLTLQRGFDLPIQERREGNVPVVSSSGVTGTHSKAMVTAPGVITGRYGTIGQTFFLTEDYWPLNTTLFVKDFKGNDPRFVYYLLKTIDFASCSDKSSVPGVNRNHLHSLPVSVPESASEQRAIAQILGTLDDKIELNRRINDTLEAMARAIFKSWFVDFDPVHAKAEGRKPPGIDATTAAHFPDSFEDSPLGKIPKRWRIVGLGDIAVNSRRGVHPKEAPDETPYIGLEHMPRKTIALPSWGRSGDVASNKFAFREGEILFGKLRPYFHKVGLAPLDGVCSTDILVISPKSPEWCGILVGHVSSEEFVAYTDAVSTGTKMPRTNWQDMARYEIVLPDARVACAFGSFAHNVTESIRKNILESHSLAAVRDTLLPKLITGKIRAGQLETLLMEKR